MNNNEHTDKNNVQSEQIDKSTEKSQIIDLKKSDPVISYGKSWQANPYGTPSNATPDNTITDTDEHVYIQPIDLSSEKKQISRLGFGYAVFTAVSIVVSLIIQISVLLADSALLDNYLFLNLITPVSLYVFALPLLLIILSGNISSRPEKKKFGVGKWLLCFIIGFGVMYIGAFIGEGVMSALSFIVGYDYSNALDTIVGESSLIVTFIFTVIVAPIGEEFVFRKLIIDRTHRYGGVICVALSALMFGIMHGNFFQFFYCVGLGLILGYMYYSSGRLLPCILLHSAINFMGGVVTTILTPTLEGLNSIDANDSAALLEFVTNNLLQIIALLVFTAATYISMIVAVILLIALRKKIKLDRGEVNIPRGRVISTFVGNIGMILMIVIYVVQFSLSLIPSQ